MKKILLAISILASSHNAYAGPAYKTNQYTGLPDYYETGVNPTPAPTATPQPTATPLPTVNSGSILFGSSANQIASQDNQNFYFDDSSDRQTITSTATEVLSNGSFTGSASGWTLASGWAYSSNAVAHTSNGTGTLTQSTGIVSGEYYLLTYTISNWTVGTVTPSAGGVTLTARSADGTYTERILTTSSASLAFTPSNTARFTIDTISLKRLTGGTLRVGQLDMAGSMSNGSPGTTRFFRFLNSGSYSWFDWLFSGTLRAALGVNSSGGIDHYQSGGNGLGAYACNSGLSSCSLYSYSTSTALVHTGYGEFNGGVHAGSITQPSSTLQSAGSTALKVKRITTSQSLDGTATHWLCDAAAASACAGTITYACSHWTNSSDCALRDSHGGCSWFAGNSCSVYNNESGMSTCGSTSGCTVDTASCSGPGDQYTCEAQDDSYGGSCSWVSCGGYTNSTDCTNASCTWNSTSCSGLDEGTCGMTSGCTQNYSNCSGLQNTSGDGCTSYPTGCSSTSNTCSTWNADETNCNANGCYYDSGSTNCYEACIGTYFDNCSGEYNTSCSGDFCSGSYNTGNCSGVYGAACQGSSSCGGIDDSVNCGGEAGCSWSTVLNMTLPQGDLSPDRTYFIKNDSAGGEDCIILPYSGETVEKASSLTLANYQDGVHIAYYKHTYDCSGYATEGACTPTGCVKNYSYCSWDSMSSTCSGHASCTGIGDESTCTSTQYYTGCSGTEIKYKNWYKFGAT